MLKLIEPLRNIVISLTFRKQKSFPDIKFFKLRKNKAILSIEAFSILKTKLSNLNKRQF